MFEIWGAGAANTPSAENARAVDAEGWDGEAFMDAPSLSADPFAQMGARAVATERVRLAPGVTNPFTRHPAVVAEVMPALRAAISAR